MIVTRRRVVGRDVALRQQYPPLYHFVFLQPISTQKYTSLPDLSNQTLNIQVLYNIIDKEQKNPPHLRYY